MYLVSAKVPFAESIQRPRQAVARREEREEVPDQSYRLLARVDCTDSFAVPPVSKLVDHRLGRVAQPVNPLLRARIEDDHTASDDALTVCVAGELPTYGALFFADALRYAATSASNAPHFSPALRRL